MVQVGTFRSSGGALGGDRRFRLQGINLGSQEEPRKVWGAVQFSTALFGNASVLPTNFVALVFGIALGPDLVNPPTGDPGSNPTTNDWLGVWETTNYVLPRSIAATINGYELRIAAAWNEELHCPRVPIGVARSIWLVTSPLPPVQAGTVEWNGVADMSYYSVRP
jgi:hypothetical protein